MTVTRLLARLLSHSFIHLLTHQIPVSPDQSLIHDVTSSMNCLSQCLFLVANIPFDEFPGNKLLVMKISRTRRLITLDQTLIQTIKTPTPIYFQVLIGPTKHQQIS